MNIFQRFWQSIWPSTIVEETTPTLDAVPPCAEPVEESAAVEAKPKKPRAKKEKIVEATEPKKAPKKKTPKLTLEK